MGGVAHASPGMILVMVLLIGPILYSIRRVRDGKRPHVRRIPGVDAINEVVGGAVEQGRPISFSTGLTSIGPVLYACLGVLTHVARRAAVYKSKLLIPQRDPEVMAIVEEVARDAYRAEHRLAHFDPSNVLYLSDAQFAFAAGYMGMVHRENVGAAFLFGDFAAESLILAEAGQQVGAMQVAASVSPEQVPFFICACDYTLIGEELYAASAYLTPEAVQLGSLYGLDRGKLVFLVFILLGVCIATWNALNPSSAIPFNVDQLLLKQW